MNRFLFVIFNDFEIGMIHAKALAAKLRFAENDQLLLGADHFLDVMQIEPAKDQRLAERIRVRLLERRFKNSATAKPTERCLDDMTGQTKRFVGFLAREFRKLMAIFVASRIMREQIFHRRDAESAQGEKFRTRYPVDFLERL